MTFSGSLSEYLNIFNKNGCQYTVQEQPNQRVRVKIGGVTVDWWPMSRNKSVLVQGRPPEAVKAIRMMIAIEIGDLDQRTLRPYEK